MKNFNIINFFVFSLENLNNSDDLDLLIIYFNQYELFPPYFLFNLEFQTKHQNQENFRYSIN